MPSMGEVGIDSYRGGVRGVSVIWYWILEFVWDLGFEIWNFLRGGYGTNGSSFQ